MKLAAGLMLVGALWSYGALAAEPGVAGKTLLVRAVHPQEVAPETKPAKPSRKQKAQPADKVELKAQETPKSATAVTPEVTEESVQLKGVRG